MKPECETVGPVFLEYRMILARYIQSRVKDPVDSEELLSEVMMKIYTYCEKLDHVRNTEAWLITIARNAIADYFRSGQKQNHNSLAEQIATEEEGDLITELSSCVPALLRKLPEKYATPLIRYEMDGIPQKALAQQFGMSESGLKSRVQRGRKMLKALFAEYCGHLLAREQSEACHPCDC